MRPSSRTKGARRVLVVDDSPICRSLLREILEVDGDLVVTEAATGAEAIASARANPPDVITMDVQMPGLDGLETVARLMAETPRPVLVVTELDTGPRTSLAFEAVKRGALDVAAKPSALDASAGRALRERVRLLATIPVVRHVGGHARSSAPALLPRRGPIRLVAIAASAGGPSALSLVLGAIPATFEACLAVVQHLPVGFASPFAEHLRARTVLPVIIADRAVPLRPGTIVLATDSAHLVARGRESLVPWDGPPEGGHRPSADALFRSVAEHHGSAAVGVVLTGIGRDGAEGLLALRNAGATTIAQDEASSAVYGMPKAAAERGAASRVLGLSEIGPALARLASTRAS